MTTQHTQAHDVSAPFRKAFADGIPADHVEAVHAAFRAVSAVFVVTAAVAVFVFDDDSAVVIDREPDGGAVFRTEAGAR